MQTFQDYKKSLNEYLKQNIEEYDLPDDVDIVVMIQAAALAGLKEIPSYKGNDIPSLSIKSACKAILKRSRVKKLNKLTDRLYLLTLRAIRNGDVQLIQQFFAETVIKYIDLMSVLPKMMTSPEFKSIFDDIAKELQESQSEDNQEGDQNVSDRDTVGGEVQT